MGRKKKVTKGHLSQTQETKEQSSTGSPPVPAAGDVQLKKDIEEIALDLADQETEEEEKRPRKKYTARRKAEEEEAKAREAVEQTARSFAVLVNMSLGFLAKRMPNPIPPSEEETAAIDQAVTGVMKKYIPSIDKWKEEILLLGTLTMFAIPRMVKPKKEIIYDIKERETGDPKI